MCLDKASANDAYLVVTHKCPACEKKAAFLVWPGTASCVECGKDFKIELTITFV